MHHLWHKKGITIAFLTVLLGSFLLLADFLPLQQYTPAYTGLCDGMEDFLPSLSQTKFHLLRWQLGEYRAARRFVDANAAPYGCGADVDPVQLFLF